MLGGHLCTKVSFIYIKDHTYECTIVYTFLFLIILLSTELTHMAKNCTTMFLNPLCTLIQYRFVFIYIQVEKNYTLLKRILNLSHGNVLNSMNYCCQLVKWHSLYPLEKVFKSTTHHSNSTSYSCCIWIRN